MLIASFGPTTGWVGKKIEFENDQFVFEGHGSIAASDVLGYDQQGYLIWAYDGLREWVESVAAAGLAAPTKRLTARLDAVDARGEEVRGSVAPTPEARAVADDFKTALAAMAGANGVTLEWVDAPRDADIRIRFTRIDEGNRALRWLLNLGPALVEVDGEITKDRAEPQHFHHTETRRMALWGGDPRTLLRDCAQRCAKDVTKDLQAT